MNAPKRPIAFILAATDQGTMIVNRFDYKMTGPDQGYGVGWCLLNQSSYDVDETAMVRGLLDLRRQHFGDGVVAADIGANIGVFTVDWARHMTGWGHVVAVEAQERIFHALAGNVAINNCFNAKPFFAAMGRAPGEMRVPVPNYRAPASFGSLELRHRENTEEIGQPISYAEDQLATIPATSIDAMGFSRLDLMKVDVEGMEIDVLEGARHTIPRFLPILYIEHAKSDNAALMTFLNDYHYTTFVSGMNILAIHPSDPTVNAVQATPAS